MTGCQEEGSVATEDTPINNESNLDNTEPTETDAPDSPDEEGNRPAEEVEEPIVNDDNVSISISLSEDIMGYWPLDGNLNDTTGQFGAAQYAIAGQSNTQAKPLTFSNDSSSGQSIDLRTTDKRVIPYVDTGLSFSNDDEKTISFFVKTDDWGNSLIWLGSGAAKSSPVNNRFYLGVNNKLAFVGAGTSIHRGSAAYKNIDNNWHHYAIVVRKNSSGQNKIHVFQDGTPLQLNNNSDFEIGYSGTTQSSEEVGAQDVSRGLLIGTGGGSSNDPANAMIDDVAVFGKALSDKEIKAIALAGSLSKAQNGEFITPENPPAEPNEPPIEPETPPSEPETPPVEPPTPPTEPETPPEEPSEPPVEPPAPPSEPENPPEEPVDPPVEPPTPPVVEEPNLPTGDLGNGLLGYWPLDGNLQDLTGQNGAGSYQHNNKYSAKPEKPLTFSQDASAGLALDLRGDGVNLQPFVDTNLKFNNNGSKSFSLFVKTEDLQHELVWVGSGAPDQNGSYDNRAYIGALEQNAFVGGGTTVYHRPGLYPKRDKQWHHYAVIFHRDESISNGQKQRIKVYQDGVLIQLYDRARSNNPNEGLPFAGTTASASSRGTNGTSRGFLIGMGGGQSNHPANAIIDDVAVFNRALSENEIKAIYQAGSLSNAINQ